MGTRRVTTPSGVEWSVRRRWIPHREGKGLRERFRRHKFDLLDGVDVPFDIDVDVAGIAVAIIATIVVVIALVLGWPLLLLGIDLVWLFLVLAIGTTARVALGRPWRVEAVAEDERRDWFTSGFRAAGTLRDDLARRFQHGHDPSPTDGDGTATLTR